MSSVVQLFFRVQDRGGESFARYLGDALRQRGHAVENVGFAEGQGERGALTADWTVLADGPPTVRGVLSACRELAVRLRSERPDAVVSHTQVASLLGLPLAALARVPVRVCLHHQPHGRDLGWPFWVSDVLWGVAGIYTDVVVVSDLALDRTKRFPDRYRRRVRLIPNEVPRPELPSREEARRRFDLPPDLTTFCFIGSLSQRKGALVAARAVEAHDSTVLLMVGKASNQQDAVEQIVTTSGGRIRLIGHVTPDEMAWVLAAADCLLFPSQVENRSLAVLEAEAAGLDIIASDIRGNRDILGDGGAYVAVDDQASWIRAVEEYVERRGESGRGEGVGRPPGRYLAMVDRYESIVSGSVDHVLPAD